MLEIAMVILTASAHFAGHPVTWDARYSKASTKLKEAANDLDRFYALRDVAKAAFETGKMDEARTSAMALLDLATQFPDDWNYGNAIHDGHMVLGRLALVDGDVAKAKRELIEAGKTPGSPQLDTFGPNVSLAR